MWYNVVMRKPYVEVFLSGDGRKKRVFLDNEALSFVREDSGELGLSLSSYMRMLVAMRMSERAKKGS